MKHLKIHDKVGAVKCSHSPKTFKFESYKKRHIQRVHIMAIKVTECLYKVESDEEDLDIEVDLRESKAGEECSWQYSATFPGCETQNRHYFKSFFNTNGLFSKQDWDE